jgi:Bifunctional DNA primase/polymerase, N-terminal
MSRLESALDAARRGWPVFPLDPGHKRPHVGMTAWEQRASLDAERIARWWRRHPDDNVAIATGPAGLVVVDLDQARPGEPNPADWPRARSGMDVFAALAVRHDWAEPTWTVETASGGRHLYFRAPTKEGPWRNTTGRIGWHIDTRAAGGYVVAPGSVVDGRTYTVTCDRHPAELPRWLARLVVSPSTPVPVPAESWAPKRRGYGAAALMGEVQRVLDAPHGQRNAALNRAAWNLARHVTTGQLSRAAVEEALYAAGVAAGGQTPAGVAATIRSAIEARLRRSR